MRRRKAKKILKEREGEEVTRRKGERTSNDKKGGRGERRLLR
jgi:hypothetical protein